MNYLVIQTVLLFAISLGGTFYLIPKITSIVRYKQLMDNPNERSSHSTATPSLGGMAFFIVLIISFYFSGHYDYSGLSASIIPGLTILFFLGLKDDLVVLSPRTKVAGQIVACFFLLSNTGFVVTSLHGFLGIYEIPFWVGTCLCMFVMLAVINSFNLIDGIDGLAASIGIVAFSGFLIFFVMVDSYFLALTSLAMVGILVAFLYFNLSTKRKIFMGDTGSMLIGFMLGVMTIRLFAMEDVQLARLPFDVENLPIMVVAFLIVPLFDTSRVMLIRLINGKGPFSPDRNHMHHVLIDAYCISHRRASFLIANVNILFVVLFASLLPFVNILVLGAVLVAAVGGFSYYFNVLRKRRKKPELIQRLRRIRRVSIERRAIGDYRAHNGPANRHKAKV